MTTATLQDKETAVEYQEFTWQAIKALADKIGVPFYARSDYRVRYGYGFQANRHDLSKIEITGYQDSSGQNEFDTHIINRLAWKCFEQTLELYFLKNGINYELVKPDKVSSLGFSEPNYIRIHK